MIKSQIADSVIKESILQADSEGQQHSAALAAIIKECDVSTMFSTAHWSGDRTIAKN